MSFRVQVERRLGEARIAVDFAAAGRLTALFGPSGAGKTSVLNMIAGLLRPDAGEIVIDGRELFSATVDLPPERRGAGYIFQDSRLFPHRRVRANLAYGMDKDDEAAMGETAAFLGIAHLLDRWPRTLSGGEAQRVAIGRALLSRPKFLLMDEPLASLDRPRREEIMTLIERLRDELALPILYVSHDRAEVDRLASEVVEIGL